MNYNINTFGIEISLLSSQRFSMEALKKSFVSFYIHIFLGNL